MDVGLVLLAAGASTRYGKPKQTLPYLGQSLLQRAVQAALSSVCQQVVVVVGAHADATLPEVTTVPAVQVVENPEWQEGMAASIRCGLTNLLQIVPTVDGVIFMVCDQPFADAALLDRLVQEKYKTSKGIAASAYNDTLGTPVLFDKVYFTELLSLKGQEGAKKLVFRYSQDVVSVPFPSGSIDIDTPADYAALRQQQPHD